MHKKMKKLLTNFALIFWCIHYFSEDWRQIIIKIYILKYAYI